MAVVAEQNETGQDVSFAKGVFCLSFDFELAWGESSDDGVVDGYAIYRDGEEVAFINRWMDRRYLDEGLVSASTYCYEVRAEDTEGARSEPMTRRQARGRTGPRCPRWDHPSRPARGSQ